MALYKYVKEKSHKIIIPSWVSFGFISSGLFLMIWVLWPIFSFKMTSGDLFAKIVSPVTIIGDTRPNPQVMVASANSDRLASAKSENFVNPNNWFPAKPQRKVVTPVTSYTLSIPKLRIKDASVTIAGDDLNSSLIHYGGTALPGEYGTTVIFGHSTLPQLYDPTNYHTIFSLLPTLKAASDSFSGDEIYLTYDGITYKYQIYDMVVTKPEDLSSLEQRYDNSYLTMVTCVPPGTYWERLNVKAKLIPLQ
jgi:sortase A